MSQWLLKAICVCLIGSLLFKNHWGMWRMWRNVQWGRWWRMGHNRPWHDAWAIAPTPAVTHANQEKGSLGGRWKALPKVKLRGLISPMPNAK